MDPGLDTITPENKHGSQMPSKSAVFLLVMFLSCLLVVNYVSVTDRPWIGPFQHYSMLALNSTIVTLDGSASKPMFSVNDSANDSLVRRSIDVLNLMHDYSVHSRTTNRTVKVILRAGSFNMEGWSDGNELFKNCPVKECVTTSDYANARFTADVLLISEMNSDSVKNYLPKPNYQIWVARHLESPLANRIDPAALRDGLVNWTFTYRLESTMPIPYPPQFLPKLSFPSEYLDPESKPMGTRTWRSTRNYAHGKRKKVAWFVSNCASGNGRRAYADQLSKYIGVDIYGACGKHSCGDQCRKMLSTDYKFYLAFENQNCIEYTTEKVVSNALKNDVIPIVMGARPEDYTKLLPPYSYIHVDDFRSPKYLAEYLHILDKNDTLYNSYFKWKDTWMAVSHRVFDAYGYCRLCFLLHYRDDVHYVNWYDGNNYADWWNSACSAGWSNAGGYATWRHSNFWNTANATNIHQPPL